MRIVIDTNVWISFIISDKLAVIDNLLLNGSVRLLFSKELIDEIEAVMKKPKLKRYFKDKNAFKNMFEAFDNFIDLVEVKSEVTACRDHKDNFLLSLALDGEADFLITGDDDLLVLNPFEDIGIISVSDFVNRFQL